MKSKEGFLTAPEKTLRSGGINDMLDARVILAPMAGVSDAPFRIMCRRNGCGFAFTEMIDVNGIFYKNVKTLKYLDTLPEDRPLGVQLVGADEKRMLEGAMLCRDKGYTVIDINAGCPARKVVKGGKGAALLKDPAKLGRIIGLISSKLDVDVTVKIRAGWDAESANYLEVAKIAESEGAKAICVHPRTREEMYRGREISHHPTREIKAAVNIPVFASGNVFCAKGAEDILRSTGCDGIFVARGALGRPWIFRAIGASLRGEASPGEPCLDAIKTAMADHFSLSEKWYGSFLTVKRMYKHVTWYLKRYKNLNAVMESYRAVKDASSFEGFLRAIELDGRKMVIAEKVRT